MNISDYFAKMESIVDSLFLAGSEISEDDLIMTILMVLPSEYDVIVTTIRNRFQTGDERVLELTVQEVLAMALS